MKNKNYPILIIQYSLDWQYIPFSPGGQTQSYPLSLSTQVELDVQLLFWQSSISDNKEIHDVNYKLKFS